MSNYNLLTADGASDWITATGKEYSIEAEGTWGSGTITPQIKSYDGTAIAYGTSTLTADGALVIRIARGRQFRVALTGSTNPSLKIHASRIE